MNRVAEPVPLAAAISAKLDAGEHLALLRNGKEKTIDFHNAIVQEAFNTGQYQIYVSDAVPCNVVCVFPNYHKHGERKQVVRTRDYRTVASLNKALNKAFKASVDTETQVKLAVCYGKHVYLCRGLVGTVYLLVASHVNRVNRGNVANTLYRNVPILFNLDGLAHVKGMYIFKPEVREHSDLDRLPITHTSPVLMFDKNPLFVCETKGDVNAMTEADERAMRIRTMSRRDALALVTATTKPSTLVGDTNAFERSIDAEMGLSMDEGVEIIFTTSGNPSAGSSASEGELAASSKDLIMIPDPAEPGPDPFLE
jgi:hypothetical protein